MPVEKQLRNKFLFDNENLLILGLWKLNKSKINRLIYKVNTKDNMNIEKRVKAFSLLGDFLLQFGLQSSRNNNNKLNDDFYDLFDNLIDRVERENPWFTKAHIYSSIEGITQFLCYEKLLSWLNKYPVSEKNTGNTIAVIMAGNIPMVGFHDMLCVLISGNTFVGKLSSKDDKLLQALVKILISIEPGFENLISFTDKTLSGSTDFDAIIATGSNNSARYFEAYFSKYKHIIRKNRSSLAILTGDETAEDYKLLGKDVFQYFGLGCRNVSKLFIPEGFDICKLLDNWESYSYVYMNNKYANNYDYNRSIMLMNMQKHFDNGFVLLTESKNFVSPIGVINFEYYSNIKQVEEYIDINENNIQCVVSNSKQINNSIAYGEAQNPQLDDYADNVDTLEFLTSIK